MLGQTVESDTIDLFAAVHEYGHQLYEASGTHDFADYVLNRGGSESEPTHGHQRIRHSLPRLQYVIIIRIDYASKHP